MIAAIILAAGESKRMGSPKALLRYPAGGEAETTFLEHLLSVFTLSRADLVVAVLGHGAETIRKQVRFGSARVVVNERYADGMLSSIRVGLDAVVGDAIRAVLVCPVDHPGVTTAVVDSLIQGFEDTRAPIVLPGYAGRRGHPVLFSAAVFAELRRAPDAVGARRVVWDHERDLLTVEVSEPGVGVDVDTPGDYRDLRDSSS